MKYQAAQRFLNDMAARHGTRRGYNDGCRCDDCKGAQRLYQRRYHERSRSGAAIQHHDTMEDLSTSPGPVEVGVQAEIGSAAEARPGLVQMAFAMARILDNPKAVNQAPSAAKVLASLLDKLSSSATQGRRGRLAGVRSLTERGGA